MLLFAPQSGNRTHTQIREEGIQLRDRTITEIKKATEQIRSETERIIAQVRERVGELKQLSQDKLVEQMDRVSAALHAEKTAIEAAEDTMICTPLCD
jgi:gas vesicle protein